MKDSANRTKEKSVSLLSSCYEQDYYLWLEQTARQIDEARWDELDTANLVEEIKDMGRSERRSLESNLTVVLLHLMSIDIASSRFRRLGQLPLSPLLKVASLECPNLSGGCYINQQPTTNNQQLIHQIRKNFPHRWMN